MEISVIVPFLDEAEYIEKCVKSLIIQNTNAQFELIFIDNGSTDSSIDIVKKYPQIRLLFESERNVYAARNKGLAFAKGEIIAFTDADCCVDRNWIEIIRKNFRDNTTGIIIGKRLLPLSQNKFLKYFQDYENAKMEFALANPELTYGYTNNMAIRRRLIVKHGDFKLLEVDGDVEMVRRLSSESKLVVKYIPDLIISHMEIKHPVIWLRKVFLYGYHNYSLIKKNKHQSLTIKQNLEVYASVQKQKGYSLLESTVCLVCLMASSLAYKLGFLKAMFMSKK